MKKSKNNLKKQKEDLLETKVWSPETIKMFSEMGKKGGATLKKRGSKYFSEIGKRGAQKRWENYDKSN